MSVRILVGDCREVLKTLPDGSVDSIVTDPPYDLTSGKNGGTGAASVNLDSPYGRARIGTGNGAGGFMGLAWDSTGVAFDPETWRECLRVLKPGGHLLAFGGTRTYHRMVCAIEDAGFEIRDQIGWAYGSGFPKSLDVSKAIDKAAGAEREVVGRRTDGRYAYGFTEQAKKALGRVVAESSETGFSGEMGQITEPATEAARQWQGWGTALKPAWEPICLARKPLAGTVAANVLAHGTGALNIDGCRIGVSDAAYARNHSGDRGHAGTRSADEVGATDLRPGGGSASNQGRWPPNLIHDGSDEVLAAFPRDAGAASRVSGTEPSAASVGRVTGERSRVAGVYHADSGSAARFFYCAKADRADRNDGGADNTHPTVKPTDLMRYLCRLVTPPGGTVLDPFMGSGSTLKAAELEGFDAIGIELSPEYAEIAKWRIGADAPLFREVT